MPPSRDIVIRILGDHDSLSRSLRGSANELQTFGSKMEDAGRRAAAVGDRMSVALTGPLLAAAGGAIKAASDLGEAVNLTGRIFGEASGEIDRYAETSARAVGMSERAYREATAQVGGLLQNLGFARDETVDWSVDLATLAADLGSAFNADPAEAVQAIGSALRGETEPIRRFNVMLDDAAVRAKAVELGFAATAAEVDKYGKAQATLALITEQTSAVQGDFAATADGAANSQRILKANVEDAAAALGESLLPIAEDVLGALNGLVESFTDLPASTQRAIVSFGAVVAAMGPMLSVGGRVIENFRNMGSMLLRGGPWGLAVGVGVLAIGSLAKAHLDAQARVREYTDAIMADSGALGENTDATIENALAKDELYDDLAALGITTEQFIAAVKGEADALADVENALGGTSEAMREAGGLDTERWESIDAVSAALGRESDRLAETQEQLRRTAYEESNASQAAEDFRTQIEMGLSPTSALNRMLAEAAPAIDQVAEAAVEAAPDMEYLTEATENMASGLRSFGDPMTAFDAAFDDGKATLSEWITEMDKVTRAQQDFTDNMAQLATRVSDETFAAFVEMAERNPEQAALMAQQAVEATDEELAALEGSVGRHVDAAIDSLASRAPQMNQVAQQFGSGAVSTLESALARGVLSVSEIAYAYTEGLRQNVNPILIALDGQSIPAQARILNIPVGVMRNAGGPIPGSGPDEDSVPALLTPGEFVMRRRAVQMYGPAAMEAINDGSAEIRYYNTGGYVSLDEVPPVPSVAPARSYVGDPGTAMMARAREVVVDWLKQNLAPELGPGIGWQAMWQALQTASAMGQIPSVQLFSAFRPGAITATGNPSYHGMGRAVDITPSMPIFDWLSANYGPMSRELIYSPANARQWRNGGQRTYGEPTRGDHWDHIHWAMANGAIVRSTPSGTRALIGEGGSDEAVIPLDRPLAVSVRNWQDLSLGDLDLEITPVPVTIGQGLNLGGLGPQVADPASDPNFVFPGRPQDLAPEEIAPGGRFIERYLPVEVLEEIAANAEALRIEALPAAERLLEVRDEMAHLEALGLQYTDEWVDLLREGQGLETDIAQAQEDFADRARARAEASAEAAADLAEQLERQAEAQRQAADEAERAAASIAESTRRQADEAGGQLVRLLEQRDQLNQQAAEATASYARAVADAQTGAAREIDSLLRARQDALFGAFGQLDQRFSAGWGNLTSQYADELDRRFELFDEWADGIQRLRDRGLSEDVIAQLGLDDPSRLADVRLFVRATDAELTRLTTALERNSTQTADQAQTESDLLLGALGESIVQVRQQLADTMAELNATLTERLGEIAEQTAQLGLDTGRGYAEALTEALASGLPGVIAIAQQYQQALADAEAAQAALAAMTGDPLGSHGNSSGTRPSATLGLRDQWIAAQSVGGSSFASDQLRAVRSSTGQAAPQVQVYIGNRAIDEHVRVEVDGRVAQHAYGRRLQGVVSG